MTLRLNGSTSGYTEIDAPAVAGSNTLILPGGNGSANERLVTNGSGTLSWSSDVMLAAGSAVSPSLYFSGDTNTGMWSPTADTLAWSTGGAERARISNDGTFTINSPLGINGQVIVGSSGFTQFYRASGAAQSTLGFYNGGNIVGEVRTSTTATSYITSSDYRLKENVVDLDNAIERLKQLPVHRFNFIADPDTVVDGFIAHEAAEVVPEAVTGTKDEVDEDDNPIYQGIDQSKLVPLLTAALQEAVAKIESLETRIAALEATP